MYFNLVPRVELEAVADVTQIVECAAFDCTFKILLAHATVWTYVPVDKREYRAFCGMKCSLICMPVEGMNHA